MAVRGSSASHSAAIVEGDFFFLGSADLVGLWNGAGGPRGFFLTEAGSRRLRHWLHHPLRSQPQAAGRHEAVEALLESTEQRQRLVADGLRDLKSKVEDVKFLGSSPAAGEHGPARRREAEAAWRQASEWVERLRGEIL